MTEDGAFETFVAESSAPLLRTAYLLTGDRRAADDLLELALIDTRRNWDRLAGPDEVVAATRRALVAAHLDWRRRLQAGDVLGDVPMFAGLAGPRSDPAPARPPVVQALAQLPPRTRAVLVLRYGEGLSVAATAAAADVSEEQVRQATAQGLDRVADAVGGAGPGVAGRLRAALVERAGDVGTTRDDRAARVLDGLVAQRRNRAALLTVVAFLVLVTLLVAGMIILGAGR